MSETVFVAANNESMVYHTNEDCWTLQQATSYRAVARESVADDRRHCRYGNCGGSDNKDNVYDSACPRCGEIVSKNALRYHLPCDGVESAMPDGGETDE